MHLHTNHAHDNNDDDRIDDDGDINDASSPLGQCVHIAHMQFRNGMPSSDKRGKVLQSEFYQIANWN